MHPRAVRIFEREWLVNLILFFLGTFLDMAATILICTPIFLPICVQYGMSPVQFGMVMLINCALGLNTPPVAMPVETFSQSDHGCARLVVAKI